MSSDALASPLRLQARALHFPNGDGHGEGFRIGWTEFPGKVPMLEIPSGWLVVSVCLVGGLRWPRPDGPGLLEASRARVFRVDGDEGAPRPVLPGPHRSAVVAWDPAWLAANPGMEVGRMKPFARAACEGRPAPPGPPEPAFQVKAAQLTALDALPHPAVPAPAWGIWYEARALEWAAMTLFPEDPGLFCHRQSRIDQDRIETCLAILTRELENPPALGELARRVNISPFHLSRMFTRVTGETISQRLRRLRVERAAGLLKAGTHNVTEAALAVGYSSFGHFSSAFRLLMGVPPSRYMTGGADGNAG